MGVNQSREEILKLFRDNRDGFVSGAQISKALGVSRTAVWKQIGLLRDLGYEIEAVPSRGYHLVSSPDTLIAAEIQSELGTRIIGREVVYYPETDSTNLRAHEAGEQGAAEGTVVIADVQSAGKGRLGRRWSSPSGVNLYTSVILRPSILPWEAPQLTFLSAVAVACAVEDMGLKPELKWPNDVLIEGKKLAGLLNEMSAETEGVHFIILGIGVNLNMTAEQFPEDLRYPATSLFIESGRRVSRLDFARSLYRNLDRLYLLYLEQGMGPIVSHWQARCRLIGRRVEVGFQNHSIAGTVEGLDEDGALVLRLEDGRRERVLAGDVRPL